MMTNEDIMIKIDGKLRQNEQDAARKEAFLPTDCVQNHAANLIELDNGDLLCVWFGGTQEGIPDISIYMSRLKLGSNQWTKAVKLSDDSTRSEQNPVLFQEKDGQAVAALYSTTFWQSRYSSCEISFIGG